MSGPAEPDFRLTYASMFDPPPALHQRFDAALRQVRAELGGEHAMTIDGRRHETGQWFEVRSPIDTGLVLGRFALGDAPGAAEAFGRAEALAPDEVAYATRRRLAEARVGEEG